MKIVEPYVELVDNQNPFKQIEQIGRLCYKSEDKITEDSWKKFITNLINNKHYAMLEHGIFHFELDNVKNLGSKYFSYPGVIITQTDKLSYLITVSFSAIIQHHKDDELFENMFDIICNTYKFFPYGAFEPKHYIFGSGRLNLIDEFIMVLELSKYELDLETLKHQFYSLKFICNRGISHELVRHRCSVAQESTRYCNYSKDKFGEEVNFVLPSAFNDWDISIQQQFLDTLISSEDIYFNMVNTGIAPQHARDILPNALKTELVLTMPMSQWEHFFNIRYFGTTGKPHPDMKILSEMAYNILH